MPSLNYKSKIEKLFFKKTTYSCFLFKFLKSQTKKVKATKAGYSPVPKDTCPSTTYILSSAVREKMENKRKKVTTHIFYRKKTERIPRFNIKTVFQRKFNQKQKKLEGETSKFTCRKTLQKQKRTKQRKTEDRFADIIQNPDRRQKQNTRKMLLKS